MALVKAGTQSEDWLLLPALAVADPDLSCSLLPPVYVRGKRRNSLMIPDGGADAGVKENIAVKEEIDSVPVTLEITSLLNSRRQIPPLWQRIFCRG